MPNNIDTILAKIRSAETSHPLDESDVEEKASMSAVDAANTPDEKPSTNPAGPPKPANKAGMYQFDNAQKAVEAAKKLGCSGFHKTGDFYMPCESSAALKAAAGKTSDAEKTAWLLDSIEVKAMYEFPDSEVLEKGYSEDNELFTYRIKHDDGVEADVYYDVEGKTIMWVRADVSDLSDFNASQAANIANVAYAGEVKSVSYDLLEDGQYAYTVEIDGDTQSTDVYVVDMGDRYSIAGAKSYEYTEDGVRGDEVEQKSDEPSEETETEEVEQKADETEVEQKSDEATEGESADETAETDDTKSVDSDVEEKSAAELALEQFNALKDNIPTE